MTGPPRSEDGNTLIEVLVSVVVLGLAVTALLGAMTTTTGTSSLSRQQADATATLTSVGAAVTDPSSYPYQCVQAPNSYQLKPGLPPVPAGWNVTIQITGYWSPHSSTPQLGCESSDTPPQQLLQELQVTVTSPMGGVTMSREFVKSPPT